MLLEPFTKRLLVHPIESLKSEARTEETVPRFCF
jgi:hypothetical protein